MEMISSLGKRTIVSSTGVKDTREWGVFKCPSCLDTVELKVSKGRVNKSCGKTGCRSKTSKNFGSWNKGMKEEDKVKNLPHYSAFSDYYRSRVKCYPKGTSWHTLKEFTAAMYNGYVNARKVYNKVSLCATNSEPLSDTNSSWVGKYTQTSDFSLDLAKGIKHTSMLAAETGVQRHIVIRTLNKMNDTFGNCDRIALEYVGDIGRPAEAYRLSEYQYTRLRDRLLDSVKSTKSTHVYLIQGSTLVKIGTTHNVSTRFKALAGSNELPLTLLYSKDVTNGTSVEKYLHKKYSEFNTHHEWFELSEDQIKEVIDYLDSL